MLKKSNHTKIREETQSISQIEHHEGQTKLQGGQVWHTLKRGRVNCTLMRQSEDGWLYLVKEQSMVNFGVSFRKTGDRIHDARNQEGNG